MHHRNLFIIRLIFFVGLVLLIAELSIILFVVNARMQRLTSITPREVIEPSPTPAMTPEPTASPSPTPIAKKPAPSAVARSAGDTSPWGVAEQIDEVTWRMKVAQDDRIATPREIHEALNVYRQQHGSGYLTWDDTLATYAQSRAKHLNTIKMTDKHEGFKEYTKDTENLKKLGFWSVGENISYGYRLSGVHLIEWIFAGDEPHDKNQLATQWSHVGVGVDGLGVAIIFGGWKI